MPNEVRRRQAFRKGLLWIADDLIDVENRDADAEDPVQPLARFRGEDREAQKSLVRPLSIASVDKIHAEGKERQAPSMPARGA